MVSNCPQLANTKRYEKCSFPQLLIFVRMFQGPSTVLVLSRDWHPGWLPGWHVLQGSPPRMGVVMWPETELKPGSFERLLFVGRTGCGARTLWFPEVSFCPCRFCCDLSWCITFLAGVCGLARREETGKREVPCNQWNTAVTISRTPRLTRGQKCHRLKAAVIQ